MTYPRVGIYASVRNKDAVLTRPVTGEVIAENVAKLARWDDVILDLGSMVEQPQIAAALRAASPAIRLHAYVVMKAYNWPGAFFKELWAVVTAMNGYLYNVDGSMWRDSNVNTARPDVVEAVAQVIARYLPGFDGLFLDVFCPGMPNATASGVDWRRAGFDSEAAFQQAWQRGHASLVVQLKSGLPFSSPITGNCGPASHADVNGWMREAFPTQGMGPGDDGWTANMIANHFGQPGLLRETYREPRGSWLCSAPAPGGPRSAENLRRHRYGLASACLGGAFHSFGRYEGDAQWCKERLDFFYPEYSHPQLGKGWLGEAVGEYFTHSGREEGLWGRMFERGRVVVNPTGAPISAYFTRRYRPLGNVAKTAWRIPAHDALIAESV